MNQQIRLKSRPAGAPTVDNFEIADAPMPAGDVVRRTLFLSLDPYMRGRMSDGPSYATPVAVGDVMCGHTVSQVLESKTPDFRAGDFVAGYDGWQTYAASNGKDLRKLVVREVMSKPLPQVPRTAPVERITYILSHENPAVFVEMGDTRFEILTKYDLMSTVAALMDSKR